MLGVNHLAGFGGGSGDVIPEHFFDAKLRVSSSSNPVTTAFTCNTGVTLLVLSINVHASGARAGGAPTYDGTPLVQAGTTQTTAETSSELWYMLAPPTGSSLTISVPNTGNPTTSVKVSTYRSSTGTSAFDVTAGTTGTSLTASQAVTPNEDGSVIIDCCGTGSNILPVSNNQTLLFSVDVFGDSDNAQYALQETAGAITFSWTQAGSDDWSIVVAAFKPV